MNLKRILSLSLIVVILTMIGCKEDDNPASSSEDDLIGTWVLTSIVLTSYNNSVLTPEQAGVSGTIIMKSDKTFESTFNMNGEEDSESGTWSATNSTITLNGETETIVLEDYSIQGNKLYVNTTIDITMLGGETPVKLEFTKQ